MTPLIISLLTGFIITYLGTPYAKHYLLNSGIYGIDQQKRDRPKLATSGGLPVFFGAMVSITTFLGITSLITTNTAQVNLILAALASTSIITLIGFIDDIHIKVPEETRKEFKKPEKLWGDKFWEKIHSEKRKDENLDRKGLGQLPKMLFVLPAAFPLIAVGAGSWTMIIPVINYTINWGLIYPLILLPLGLLFVSNVVNMLAGTNGLSTGLSLVASTSLGIFALINGKTAAALIAFSLSASLLAFLKYNFYPATILPGDSLTYLAGAAMFSTMVIGNMEKFGVFIFIPWGIEFLLKLRSRFNAHSWGKLKDNGRLKPQHDKNYSLTHPLMRRGYTEPQITAILVYIEIIICLTSLIIFTIFL